MNRIDETFERLRRERRAGFISFFTAGHPDLETTNELLLAAERAGSDLVELGIPFSDPIADGPVIQASYTRVLSQALTPPMIFRAVKNVRPSLALPLIAMISYSLIYRMGEERFLDEATQAGFDGAIVPDLPSEEGKTLLEMAKRRDFKTVLLVAPNTSAERRKSIAERSTGFIYYVSLLGITGAREKLPPELEQGLKALRKITAKPIGVGFGISRPDQAETLAPLADAVIVGSAIVKRIEELSSRGGPEILSEVESYIHSMSQALSKVRK